MSTEETKQQKATTAVLVKSSFWYTIAGFLSKAMVFLTTPLFTRLLSKEQYGDFTVFAAWQSIMVVICGLEVYATINRARFDYTTKEELDGYISSSLLLSTIFTAIVFLVYFLFPQVFHSVFLMEDKYLIQMFLYLFFFPAFAMFQAKQRIEYKYKLSASITFGLVIGSSILAVTLAILMPSNRLGGRIFGQYVLYIIAGMLFYAYFLKNSVKFRFSYMKYALRLAVPLVFSYLGSTVLLSSDNLIVKHMCSGEQVSYISITHTCAHIILILVQLLNGAWSPWFYDKLNVKEYKTIRKIFAAYVWLVIFGTFMVLLFAPELVRILGGKGYSEAIYIIPVNILNGVFSVFTYQFVNLETFYKKPEYAAIITGVVAVINVALDIIGVKIWDYRAVCYATLLCQILLVSIHYVCTRKMEVEKILAKKDLVLYSAAAIALIPISLLLYQNNTVRWVFIAVIMAAVLGVAVWKRKELIVFAKKLRAR